jgi:ribonuclease PH
MTSQSDFVEIQGAAEARPFSKETIDILLSLAERGIEKLFAAQKAAIDSMRA